MLRLNASASKAGPVTAWERPVGSEVRTAGLFRRARHDGRGVVLRLFGFPLLRRFGHIMPVGVKMGVNLPNGLFVWLLINSEALIRLGEFEPYAVVLSFSDITDSVNREEELRKSNERFFYVSKITSDAIWDIDIATNQIYRSETFYELSGYTRDEIKTDMDWWFNKVHPKDRERVRTKVKAYIQNGRERWED